MRYPYTKKQVDIATRCLFDGKVDAQSEPILVWINERIDELKRG